MTPSRSGLASLAAAVLVTGATANAEAAVHHGPSYYVNPAGSDANPGTSARPFQHIQQCARLLVAGDTCVIATGTYRETVTPANSGTANSPITYTAAPGATLTIDGTDASPAGPRSPPTTWPSSPPTTITSPARRSQPAPAPITSTGRP